MLPVPPDKGFGCGVAESTESHGQGRIAYLWLYALINSNMRLRLYSIAQQGDMFNCNVIAYSHHNFKEGTGRGF